jgi:L-ascorbate metabolism protein UlaG (beta-lactamase superfamily)
MKLTKHAHACVELDKDAGRLVIDPGTLTPDAAQLLAGAAAVLITHEHFDHIDEAALTAALDARPSLLVYAPRAVCEKLPQRPGQVTPVSAGDRFEAAGFAVQAHGRQHAMIHPDIPIVENVGYLIDERVFHPGDAYTGPGVPVDLLLMPTSGPWTQTAEAVDFVRGVRPDRLVQIHELMLSELGQNTMARFLGADGLTGIPFTILPVGESLTA